MSRSRFFQQIRELDPTGEAIIEHKRSKGYIRHERINDHIHVVLRSLRRKRPTWEVVAYVDGRRWNRSEDRSPYAMAFLNLELAEAGFNDMLRDIIVNMAVEALRVER